ncbi:hypothetical protein B0F90DRAFT_1775298, partial [Multifurca ochricompacta]
RKTHLLKAAGILVCLLAFFLCDRSCSKPASSCFAMNLNPTQMKILLDFDHDGKFGKQFSGVCVCDAIKKEEEEREEGRKGRTCMMMNYDGYLELALLHEIRARACGGIRKGGGEGGRGNGGGGEAVSASDNWLFCLKRLLSTSTNSNKRGRSRSAVPRY